MVTNRLVRIFEVGPRDGLQNETRDISTAQKIQLIEMLADAGFEAIEAGSFVSPNWVPRMADSAKVMTGIARREGVRYSALTPNLIGYERARAARADEVAVFAAASEGFSQNNINCSIDESFDRFAPILDKAGRDGVPVRGYLSCVIACPFDGPTEPGLVGELAARLIQQGCYEVSLGDTIGAGDPETVARMLEQSIMAVPVQSLAGHFHDTGGRALANIEIALELGLRTFDSSVAGLGGCPYAPGAPGNVATGAVVGLLHRLGFDTAVNLDRLALAEEILREIGIAPRG